MHSTSQKSMEKMGEDAFNITKVHGENGRRCSPHMEKTGEDAVHGENGRRCIPHNTKSMEKMGEDAIHITKSPWRKWEKMHST